MTTAFVLSGGGSLGAVQAGMMLALAERGVVPDLLVGTSVGALNAAYLAAGPSYDGARALATVWSGLRRRDVFPLPGPGAVRALAGHDDHLIDPAPLRRLLTKQPALHTARECAVACRRRRNRGDDGPGGRAGRRRRRRRRAGQRVAAGVFPPVAFEGHTLIDGGVVNHTPISAPSISVRTGSSYFPPVMHAHSLRRRGRRWRWSCMRSPSRHNAGSSTTCAGCRTRSTCASSRRCAR